MTRIAVFLCMVILHAAAALAAPAVVVEKAEFDFGTVSQEGSVEHAFPIRNGGDQPLEIRKITTSCGCTAANTSSRSIAPGKKGEINITFDPANFAGPVLKTVTVETNDPQKPAVSLKLKGIVSEILAVTPKQLSLGQMKSGSTKEAAFTIENRGKTPANILQLRSSGKQMSARAQKMRIDPGEKVSVQVTVNPAAGDRIVSGYIMVQTDARKKEMTVPVFGSLKE